MRIPTKRAPSHPGEILLTEFLEPLGLSQPELADAIHVPYQQIDELVNGKRGITPSTALRLSTFLGNSAEFWLNLQQAWELYQALYKEKEVLAKISPFQGNDRTSGITFGESRK
ncbi:HigA protein (antitoxin to HigB) [Geitlerinema sp. FC II]|uniref:HigA family addiction module antitoxin n=1 Tax=Baaleninema simplex TaxID=2862350 RepID=UPI0003449DF0|nr:HigA family addiction module antitoxin [Baaleninema simplex]PPT07869.1 HigA protein (antitoxin to HigB) [Geitlerinema sp. FC II]